MELVGKITPSGWRVCEPVTFSSDHTGGYFSSCFFVEKEGRRAFLKALDIEKFDISELMPILAGFQYESELVALCGERRLSRIVQVLESGKLERDEAVIAVLKKVPFLVFELADCDIRDSIDVSSAVSDQWRFFVLHQATLALLQLHSNAIAHQDLKPSNVLIFGPNRLKLGDLGRSSLRGRTAPHDDFVVAGARNYAPFEQRYGYVPDDWVVRRLNTDVFHLGCLIVFVFTNVCFPEYVMMRLQVPHRPENWGAPYDQVCTHIHAALVESLNEISDDFPARFRADLKAAVLDLCNPDPARRGRANVSTVDSAHIQWLQRYASRFDRLEKTARVRVS